MSAYGDLIVANVDVHDHWDFAKDLDEFGNINPYTSDAGLMSTTYLTTDNHIDFYHVTTPIDFGIQFGDDATGYEGANTRGLLIFYSDMLSNPAQLSIECVVRINNPTDVVAIMGLTDITYITPTAGVSILHDPSAGLVFLIGDNTTPFYTYANPSSGPSFVDTFFHHIVVVLDEPTVNIYVDGTLVHTGSQTIAFTTMYNVSYFTVDQVQYPPSTYLSGGCTFDDAANYTGILTSDDVTNHWDTIPAQTPPDMVEVVLNGYILSSGPTPNPIALADWRGGNISLDFDGDGQFERWRGGRSPIGDITEVANKITIFLEGYIFDPEPITECNLTGYVQDENLLEVELDGWVFADTLVILTGLVVDANKRLYPRDNSSRIVDIVTRDFPLEP